MRAFSNRKLVCILVYLVFSLVLGAGPAFSDYNVKICGETTYIIEARHVSLMIHKVQNFEPGGKSGTLSLVLWATTTPYAGGDTLEGTVFFDYAIGEIEGGHYLALDGSFAQDYNPPPAGTYYITLTLNEYTPEGVRMREYTTFPGAVSLGSIDQTLTATKDLGCNPLPPDQNDGPTMTNDRVLAEQSSDDSGCFISTLMP